jgi:hypothetical protein
MGHAPGYVDVGFFSVSHAVSCAAPHGVGFHPDPSTTECAVPVQ